MERLLTSKVSVSNSNVEYLIGKSILAVNLPLKNFRVILANANSDSVKSLHTLFDMYLDYMLEEFEPSRTVRNVQI